MNRPKKALVTGGTRGIGSAIAARLKKDGLHVTVTGRSKKANDAFDFIAVDFEDENSTSEFLKRVSDLGVDVLINNAGINKIAPFGEIAIEDFAKIQRVNLEVPLRLNQAVLPHMRKQGWGRIVSVSSVFGLISKEMRASYSASKFGLDGMSTALAVEVAPEGILVNCVAPGFIDTDLTRQILGPAGVEKLTAQVPMRRLGRAEEIAPLVAWLASEENTFLTGQSIAIDGGFTRV